MHRMIIPTVLMLLAAAVCAQSHVPEPLHYTKLLPFLPDKVEGYVAEKPGGSSAAAMGFKLSEVSRTYHRGTESGTETVTVKITDGAGNQFFAAAHAAGTQFSHQTDDGYEKGFILDGFPAVEKFTADTKDGSLNVFIAGRYLVEVTTSGLESPTLEEWWKKIDTKKLLEAKPS